MEISGTGQGYGGLIHHGQLNPQQDPVEEDSFTVSELFQC